VALASSLAEEGSVVAELELDLGARQQGVSLADPFRDRDLAFRGDRAFHTAIVKK
jgi:hypothetical protein